MGYRSLDAEDFAFFNRWLQNSDGPLPAMVTLNRPVPQNPWCTSTGQVVTALPGKTICQINRERAAAILPSKSDVSSRAELAKLQAQLKEWIPSITGMNPVAQISLTVTVTGMEHSPRWALTSNGRKAPCRAVDIRAEGSGRQADRYLRRRRLRGGNPARCRA
jgi:hypothetical protein